MGTCMDRITGYCGILGSIRIIVRGTQEEVMARRLLDEF